MQVSHSWEFFLSSKEAWAAMYDACEKAKSRIDFEQFIFANDSTGKRFAELLMRKAKEGLSVRLLVDSAGSYDLLGSALAEEMKAAGVDLVFFSALSAWKIKKIKLWLFRDHRKSLIIDDEIGFIGGVGIGDRLSGWRDTHIRIEGPVVADLVEAYGRIWRTAVREKFARFAHPRVLEGGFMIVPHAPHFRHRYIYRTYVEAIRNAKRYVYLSTPYFVPDRRLFRVMRLAARRGVDVRILVPEHSDHPRLDSIADAHFGKALRSGMRVFKYPHNMMHSKTLVIDNDWASVGSCNIDDSSLFFNYEITLVGVQPKFAETVRTHFDDDLLVSREYTHEAWKARSWFHIAQEFFYLAYWRAGFWLLKRIFFF